MIKTIVAVIDAGGRGSALIDKYAQSDKVSELIAIPGNDLMQVNTNKPVRTFPLLKTTSKEEILKICQQYQVALVDVAQDNAVEAGVSDLLRENGFTVVGPSRKDIIYDDIVSETLPNDSVPSGKFLKNTGVLSIRYSSQLPFSTLIIHKPNILFDKSGHFEPLDVNWSGKMASKRVGDLLPYDYKITEPLNEQDKEH